MRKLTVCRPGFWRYQFELLLQQVVAAIHVKVHSEKHEINCCLSYSALGPGHAVFLSYPPSRVAHFTSVRRYETRRGLLYFAALPSSETVIKARRGPAST